MSNDEFAQLKTAIHHALCREVMTGYATWDRHIGERELLSIVGHTLPEVRKAIKQLLAAGLIMRDSRQAVKGDCYRAEPHNRVARPLVGMFGFILDDNFEIDNQFRVVGVGREEVTVTVFSWMDGSPNGEKVLPLLDLADHRKVILCHSYDEWLWRGTNKYKLMEVITGQKRW